MNWWASWAAHWSNSALSEFHLELAREWIVVLCAPNGARRTRADHPSLPITPAQLADEAYLLAEAGVSVLHLHVRDAQGRHSLGVAHYREAISAIRDRVGDSLIIQVTSESVGRYDRFEQMAMVRELRPEAVSLALRELCPGDAALPEATEFYAWLQREEIWAQHILYTVEDVARFDALRRQGVFAEEHPWCLLVLGNYAAGRDGSAAEFSKLMAAADLSQVPWSVCCFGPWEHQAALAACREGGHVRLGFENNLLRADGRPAQSNAELVSDFVTAMPVGRKPITAEGLRDWRADQGGI